jgi:DNA-directed RNA polymerase subunit M/transcription elongation factor TFIIS
VALKRKIMPWVKFCDNCGAIVWTRRLTINDSNHCWRCQSELKK